MLGPTGGNTPRIDLLLRRLMLLAGEVRDQLATGDWETAAPVQEEYDEAFASLQRLVETGHLFEQRHANELARLRHVHEENVRLARDLQRSAGVEVGSAARVQRINRAYSPLGSNHRPPARLVDGSA